MHKDGEPYSWSGGDEFPLIPADVYEQVFEHLAAAYATEVSLSRASVRGEVLANAISEDPIAQALYDRAMVLREDGDKLVITCPWEDEHTTESSDTATIYYPAHTGGFPHGGFDCKHGHCADRTVKDLDAHLNPSVDDFDDISDDAPDPVTLDSDGEPVIPVATALVGWFKHHVPFTQRPVHRYLIKGMLPFNGVATVFGASGSGKSFLTLDMVMAIARGEPWQGHRVQQGSVAYMCAEGFIDFQDRVDAYGLQNQVDPCALPFYLMGQGIEWLSKDKRALLLAELRKIPNLRVLVLDTLSKLIAGQNENDNAVMSAVTDAAEKIAAALGILVVFVHHTGKGGADRGPRGGSAFEAGIDSAIYVDRPERGDVRIAKVAKLKGGADGGEFNFKLQLVSLDRVDEDGDQLFSCVIKATNEKVGKKDNGRGVNQEALMLEFDIAFDLTNESVHEDALIASAKARREAAGAKVRTQTMREAFVELLNRGVLVRADGGVLRG
jgi:hypothetical protein